MAAVKRLLEQRRDALPENARWDDDDLLVFVPPDDLSDLADTISFEDWGADR